MGEELPIIGLAGEELLNRIERQVQDLRESLHEARVAANDADGRAHWAWIASRNHVHHFGAEHGAELHTLVEELALDALRLRKQVHTDSLEIAGKASHVLDVIRRSRKV